MPGQKSLSQLKDYLAETHAVFISIRKLKKLKDHHWIHRKGCIIPWGFFAPQAHILRDEASFLAVSKPPFLPVVASENHQSLHHLMEAHTKQKLWVVHRLDYETSGVVLFAKDALTYQGLSALFKERAIRKKYYVWVYGQPKSAKWTCRSYLKKYGARALCVSEDAGGKSAETRFRVLEKGVIGSHSVTLLEATPKTGRFHQIRAQLFDQGLKVVGDGQYGEICRLRRIGVRLMLHSASLEFTLAQKLYRIEASCPADFGK